MTSIVKDAPPRTLSSPRVVGPHDTDAGSAPDPDELRVNDDPDL